MSHLHFLGINRRLILVCAAVAISLTGCKKASDLMSKFRKSKHEKIAVAEEPSASAPASSPVPETASVAAAADVPAAPAGAAVAPAAAINKAASTIVLCYHNIENTTKSKALTISATEFEKEMQALKDNNFSVIGMQDFLAFRRGEKDIPAKSAIITIDDGWVSGYDNAWPILKKFNYPFTLFIYVNYVGTGGKSMSWEQLAEMRDAGVDIQCHTYSHSNLKIPGGGMDKTHAEMVKRDVATLTVDGWLRKEIVESKQVLEKQLGVKINAFAYPFGVYNAKARQFVKDAGYEAAFTVYGQQLRATSPPYDLLGRYAIDAGKPQIFYTDALKMIGGGVGGPPAPGPAVAQIAAASMVTQPMEGETISDPNPTIKANLATMGNVDASSIEMRVSGLGLVPATFDPKTKTVTYKVTQKLRDKNYTVLLSAKVDGRKAETRWTFNFDPNAKAGTKPIDAPLPPRAGQ
ncbi:MAG: hypothetical protein QOD99_754 [Chthoniobacter sp.]|jgi:peptidoglycan/xylan/chitin deacetylase (PgdA/CDA1 family)|nr:hypothetical protein [Chthoniobacter sp.]